MDFRKPDVKAPRFRWGHTQIINKKLFEKFKEKYPNHSNINYKTFISVIKKDNEKILDLALENRDGVELREFLGNIIIVSCQSTKKSPINYKESRITGKIIIHKNWDSDNRMVKIMYTNCVKKFGFENKNLWGFKAVREFKKRVSEMFKLDYTKYLQIDNRSKLSDIIK